MPRLDQLLSSLGYGSRKQVADIVKAGRVRSGDLILKKPDQKVEAADVTLDGAALEAPYGLLAMLHKPLGHVCTHSDGEGPTIYELLPAQWMARKPAVTSIGRLDKNTSGLILITDLGPLVHRYTSPKAEVEKIYEVTVDRELDPALIATFASGGVMLRGEEKPCLPAKLEITSPLTASLTLMEGRYHQVRRMFASQGWHVEKLHRSRFGDYTLGNLAPGEWQMLELPADPA
ncbi:16S rRNA pseudouridine516 synthase [Prosthecobacter fusiformis]|uniref:Pseudouridine synthase n=1 Tax=Prosthecobacter fusiformis TaxID=48464 RepID=A0A4R7RND1_9BACT|nr:pseudouridine synthase [Prosthecobacter fusiformis]TDU66096.1 16S rRNA pseudouridine516 synthase [Prosthecobacter fusiformis]